MLFQVDAKNSFVAIVTKIGANCLRKKRFLYAFNKKRQLLFFWAQSTLSAKREIVFGGGAKSLCQERQFNGAISVLKRCWRQQYFLALILHFCLQYIFS